MPALPSPPFTSCGIAHTPVADTRIAYAGVTDTRIADTPVGACHGGAAEGHDSGGTDDSRHAEKMSTHH